MHSIFRELEHFVSFSEFFTNISRKRVSYEWPRQALGSGFGFTVGTSIYTMTTGKITPILGASVALLGAAIVWSLCCIAWNAWLAAREEVGAMICTTLNAISQHHPCADGWAKLLAHLGKTGPDDEPLPLVTILDSNGILDALWALRTITGEDERIRRYAVWCARQVQHLMTDPRSVNALDVAERHADGLATDDELRVASAAAWDAVRDAAGDSAMAAAEAAAWTTAWTTARATRVAAEAAARTAAWATARDAARDAMRERQAARFREVFAEQEVERE